jgi:hypothetical protein
VTGLRNAGILTGMRAESLPMTLIAWVDCPVCGRIDGLQKPMHLDKGSATALTLRSPFICQQCGTRDAALVLERHPASLH